MSVGHSVRMEDVLGETQDEEQDVLGLKEETESWPDVIVILDGDGRLYFRSPPLQPCRDVAWYGMD